MSELSWLTDAPIGRPRPFFPKSRGKPRADDRRVLSGIIFVQRKGLLWSEAPNAVVRVSGPNALRPMARRRRSTSVGSGGAGWFRNALIERGIAPCIPSRIGRKGPIPRDASRYRLRRRIENMLAHLKGWRRIATRYDRRPILFLSACALAATVIYGL
ncbi:transposase (plasmid) [Paracoccus pantotrophus]|uniref:Transposase n=1 Tax=Paracoccus pantotrophus TaxID=82367 RepID=A0A7H9BZD6_PARPN|nr:transposase [Paracoccus pantotrophus]QLH16573.1 hypothetical protein HYQ43_20280 [Paracoccus pantotrophus]RNI15455.1 hypothetical protein EB844_17280 [Paracoccus pantotrophus]